ncbi:LPS export ABC transporter ATP-binding protein [Thiothrix lacustris]|uniref:Lipopolysaccharide export system ATP-binding protein LptB n=1 Tax=Thiothrix lacustris TaxID=525917 RepID=A0ABY9MPF6_9GAMM|nr:LPS export ABC transporter ATP-binding protein [Thiothrix lacustris]WML90262.1 LPS export ABC transporter ATP-binding protein [Thiothrix lacustris]
MNTLSARNLQKSYKKRQILKGVDLHVNTAEVVGLLGPNGAGKTTCFYIIVGLVGADAGQVMLNDKDMTAAAMHERAREGIGYLPQEASIFRKLTVAQNIMAVLELRKELNRSQRQAKVDSLLEEFQLTHLRDSQGISLSGGERRRAEIARALASEPAFILLDEPFAGVDPISVLEIQKIIRHLVARDIGVLITDHNVRETLGICHRAYILSEGKILVEGSPDDILQNEQARRVYLGENFKL